MATWQQIRRHLANEAPASKKYLRELERLSVGLEDSVELYMALETLGLHFVLEEDRHVWCELAQSHVVYMRHLKMKRLNDSGKDSRVLKRYIQWYLGNAREKADILQVLDEWINGVATVVHSTPRKDSDLYDQVVSIYGERMTPRGIQRCIELIKLAPSLSESVVRFAMSYVLRGDLKTAYEFPLFAEATLIADRGYTGSSVEWYKHAYPTIAGKLGAREMHSVVTAQGVGSMRRIRRDATAEYTDAAEWNRMHQELSELSADISNSTGGITKPTGSHS